MLNLIRRDYILLKWQILIFIPFVLFFIFFGDHLDPAFIFLIASFYISFSTYTYDEKAETNRLLNSLPYTRKEIIASRYLGGMVHMIVAIAFTSALLFIFNKPYTVTDIAISSALFLVFASLFFPLFYVIKKGFFTPVVIISFLVISFIGPPIASFFANHVTAVTNFINNLSVPALYSGSVLVSMFIYAVSWGISVIIYERKAF
ncbi:ABC-2 transporter permease [Longirhabdus pacifica]|uniref:ABC-2 transporter permease n=1 Tax=Longirhabdus pacifica TaxID=2305227 RepID=UPI001008CCF4|nr:ABC-2 transporter permease [Longirhabdus pacifica]